MTCLANASSEAKQRHSASELEYILKNQAQNVIRSMTPLEPSLVRWMAGGFIQILSI
jgi:hypothetical protein